MWLCSFMTPLPFFQKMIKENQVSLKTIVPWARGSIKRLVIFSVAWLSEQKSYKNKRK